MPEHGSDAALWPTGTPRAADAPFLTTADSPVMTVHCRIATLKTHMLSFGNCNDSFTANFQLRNQDFIRFSRVWGKALGSGTMVERTMAEGRLVQ